MPTSSILQPETKDAKDEGEYFIKHTYIQKWLLFCCSFHSVEMPQ